MTNNQMQFEIYLISIVNNHRGSVISALDWSNRHWAVLPDNQRNMFQKLSVVGHNKLVKEA